MSRFIELLVNLACVDVASSVGASPSNAVACGLGAASAFA